MVEGDKIDMKQIKYQGKDENVSITIENSLKIMLIDIENSWILTLKKKLKKQMAIFVSCTHLILG